MKKWLSIIGILLFAYIISKINILKTLKIIADVNLWYILLATLIYAFYTVIRIWKWQYLLKKEGIEYKFKELFYIYFIGMYFGIVTPGRIGDFVKITYFKEKGHSIKKAFITVFVDRLTDLIVLFTVGYFGMYAFARFLRSEIYWATIIILGIALIGVLMLLNKKLSKKIIEKIFNIFIPKKYKEKYKFSFSEFFTDLTSLNKKTLATVLIIAFGQWFVYYIKVYVLALALGINIPFVYVMAAMAISSISTLIPISISGVGTRDAVFIILFALVGIGREQAVALSTLVLAYLLIIALIGLYCWTKKPINLKVQQNNT